MPIFWIGTLYTTITTLWAYCCLMLTHCHNLQVYFWLFWIYDFGFAFILSPQKKHSFRRSTQFRYEFFPSIFWVCVETQPNTQTHSKQALYHLFCTQHCSLVQHESEKSTYLWEAKEVILLSCWFDHKKEWRKNSTKAWAFRQFVRKLRSIHPIFIRPLFLRHAFSWTK